jgi:hypothetical protein
MKMNISNIITAIFVTLTIISIVIAVGGIISTPYLDDIYNEIYNNSRLQRPENTIIYFISFPIIQILMTIIFIYKYSGENLGNKTTVSIIFVICAHILFTILQFSRLLKAIHYF